MLYGNKTFPSLIIIYQRPCNITPKLPAEARLYTLFADTHYYSFQHKLKRHQQVDCGNQYNIKKLYAFLFFVAYVKSIIIKTMPYTTKAT